MIIVAFDGSCYTVSPVTLKALKCRPHTCTVSYEMKRFIIQVRKRDALGASRQKM